MIGGLGDKRMDESLDRHITGNYGEDQFKNVAPEFVVELYLSYWEGDETNNVLRHSKHFKTEKGAEAFIAKLRKFFVVKK